MSLHALPDSVREIPSPSRFTYPFCYVPHPLCVAAAEELKAYVDGQTQWRQELSEGKMLGVLVVESEDGKCPLEAEHLGQSQVGRQRLGSVATEEKATEERRGFLAAFSGTLQGRTQHPYFVPPVYDLMEPGSHFQREEQEISAINHRILQLQASLAPTPDEARADEAVTAARHRMQEAKQQRDALRHTLKPDELARYETKFMRESQFLKAELHRAKLRQREIMAKANAESEPIRQQVEQLRIERQERSQALQRWLFGQFSMLNARGERLTLTDIFHPAIPPSGAGECCAPKLLQYAYTHALRPLCMAEFWVGDSPVGEVREAGHYYPACHSKCRPILGHMLQGLSVDDDPLMAADNETASRLRILYETDSMVVVSKPAGMLSVAGKEMRPSVQSVLRARYPEACGPMIVHRLDMDTSGLMVVALTEECYHRLQELFLKRQVEKTYIALLERPMPVGEEGEISLPLRPDLDDRPRQMVDDIHGRRAVTRYRVLGEQEGHALVELHPLTGRTHQLRVHCAHCRGLANPIVGDRLYGTPSRRLMLHAARLAFCGHEFYDEPFPDVSLQVIDRDSLTTKP